MSAKRYTIADILLYFKSIDMFEKIKSKDDHRFKTLSFYRYVLLENVHLLRDKLHAEWSHLGVLGRVYLAQEGINAQICVPEVNFEKFIQALEAYPEFKSMPLKLALEEKGHSFSKLTLKVKSQIVADGLEPGQYDIADVGTHLDPEGFNALMEKSETLVVDMRNHYESAIGRFEGAICPDADTFREELPMVRALLQGKEEQDILLYCTGGIRCEKASAYLKHHGFKRVYQLHGGIIHYAQTVRQKGLDSKFKGKNFVFDERRAERITEDVLSQCHQCGAPSDEHVNCGNEMCNLLFIQCDSCHERWGGCCTPECLDIAQIPEEERRKLRKTCQKPTNLEHYRKSLRPGETLQI